MFQRRAARICAVEIAGGFAWAAARQLIERGGTTAQRSADCAANSVGNRLETREGSSQAWRYDAPASFGRTCGSRTRDWRSWPLFLFKLFAREGRLRRLCRIALPANEENVSDCIQVPWQIRASSGFRYNLIHLTMSDFIDASKHSRRAPAFNRDEGVAGQVQATRQPGE